jgi:hypothetical protein
MSVLFGLVCILLVIFGFYHSKANSYNYDITCKNEECAWTSRTRTNTRVLNFQKQDFLEAEMVRIDSKGEYMDTSKLKQQEQSKLGYSIRLRMRVPAEEGSKLKIEKNFIFMPVDMGRRTARSGVKALMGLVSEKETPKRFSYSKGRNLSVIGVLSTFFGVVALIVVILLGRWKESVSPARMKKAS